MNMMVNIPHPHQFTHKQLKQLLIAYAQVNRIEHSFGACMAEYLYNVQQQGATCPVLNSLYCQEKQLVEYIKENRVLGGDFKARPRDEDAEKYLARGAALKQLKAIKTAKTNRYLTDDEIERFRNFFSESGVLASDFAALFGHSESWLSQALNRYKTNDAGALFRLVCLVDSEIELFESTGKCRSLIGERSENLRHLDSNEKKCLMAAKENHGGLAALSQRLGLGRDYLGYRLRNNRPIPAHIIGQAIQELGGWRDE